MRSIPVFDNSTRPVDTMYLSKCSEPNSRIYALLLFALFLVIMPLSASSQQQSYVVNIKHDPIDESAEGNKTFNILKNFLKTEVEAKLSKNHILVESAADADYTLSFNLMGPIGECDWVLHCRWKSSADPGVHNRCWTKQRALRFCKGGSNNYLNDMITKMHCLANHTELSLPPKVLPEKLCDASTDQYNLIATKCFKVRIFNKDIKDKVESVGEEIPYLINQELSADFNRYGYDIQAESCDSEQNLTKPIYMEIHGYVDEDTTYEKIYATLVLVWMYPGTSSDDILSRIAGETEHIDRGKYKELADHVVTYIKERLTNAK